MNEFLIFQKTISDIKYLLGMLFEEEKKKKDYRRLWSYQIQFHFFYFFFYGDDQIWKRMNMRTLLK